MPTDAVAKGEPHRPIAKITGHKRL